MLNRREPFALIAPLLGLLVATPAPAGLLEGVRDQADELRADYQAELAGFADRADALDLPDFAAELRAAATPPDPAAVVVVPPPRAVRGDLPPGERTDERALRLDVRRSGDAYANAAFGLARRAATRSSAEPGAAAVAIGLTRDALAANPDHAPARRVLGEVRDGDEWLTPWERDRRRRGDVPHPVFGWVDGDDVAKLEAGDRPLNGDWVPAEREALARRDFRNGWVSETEHYRVRTNHSWEEGAHVALSLERFHTFFRAVFPGFGLSAGDLKRRFASVGPVPAYRNAGGRDGKFEVHLFRTKDEYVAELRKKIPQIAVTNGLYFTGDRVAYFYKIGPHADPRTMFHEATHQLFYECTPRDRMVCEQAHFWVMEGIGCYMESFRDDGRTMTAGGDYVRFRNARTRLVRDKFFIPLDDFDARGRVRFQSDPLLSRCYSQASGLTHFFMHAEGGALRPRFTDHLQALYHPLVRQGRVAGLDRFLARPWPQLEREYARYIAALNWQPEARAEEIGSDEDPDEAEAAGTPAASVPAGSPDS